MAAPLAVESVMRWILPRCMWQLETSTFATMQVSRGGYFASSTTRGRLARHQPARHRLVMAALQPQRPPPPVQVPVSMLVQVLVQVPVLVPVLVPATASVVLMVVMLLSQTRARRHRMVTACLQPAPAP